MADDHVWFSTTNVPADFPTDDDITNVCFTGNYYRSGVRYPVAGKPRFWVKYGIDSLMRGECRTQAYVAGIVNTDPASTFRVPEVYQGFTRKWTGFIVMEFIQGATLAERKPPEGWYGSDDLKAAAAAFQQLIEMRMPAGTAPGPVDGGFIGHDLFLESLATLQYPTVVDLEKQINTILRQFSRGLSVDFQTETADGLVLCPSDANASNFIMDEEGKLWVIDFGRTCFLPPSFVSYSLTQSSNAFVQSMARLINYPVSPNLTAMIVASGKIVITGNNALGVRPKRPPPSSTKGGEGQISSKV